MAIVVFGCTYNPDGKYVSPIAPPGPLEAGVEVNDPGFTSPYYLKGVTSFTFTLADKSKPILSGTIESDGKVIHELGSSTTGQVNFSLYPYDFSDGSHQVLIRFIVGTKSGSLADKLGAEAYVVEQKFDLIVDRTQPELTAPITAAYENGYLVFRWGAPQRKNFNYIVQRTYTETSNRLADSIMTNASQNSFVAKNYVGGELEFKLAAYGYGFYQIPLGTYRMTQQPIDFSVDVDDKRMTHLKWTHSLISTANTEIKIDKYPNYIFIPFAASGDHVIDTLSLGEARTYWVYIYRKSLNFEGNRKILTASTKPNIKPFQNVVLLPQQQKLLLQSQTAIYRYNLPDLQLEDSLTVTTVGKGDFSSFTMSRDGARGVVVAGKSELVGFDPLNFATYTHYAGFFTASISATGGNAEIDMLQVGELSDNGIVTILASKNGRCGIAYDINANLIKWFSNRFPYYNQMFPPSISADGQWLAYDDPNEGRSGIYRYSPTNEFERVGAAPYGRKYFKTDVNELVNTPILETYYPPAEAQIKIYDLPGTPMPDNLLTVKRTKSVLYYSIQNGYLGDIKYDETTGLLYTQYNRDGISRLTMMDVSGFQTTATCEAMTFAQGHHFISNYQIINRGFIEKVK